MGDSTCLMQQPFCYASGISNEANESNRIHALGQSISFGRFMSESLAWEKWSTFSHNRYVEEAERFARPGSVAQKKAFFEAHYKKLAAQKAATAAAMLEQANNNAQNNTKGQDEEKVIDNDTHDSRTSTISDMVIKDEQDEKVLSLKPDVDAIVTGHDSKSKVEASVSVTNESNKVEGIEPEMEHVAVVGNSMEVELQNQLDEVVDTQKEQSEKISGSPPVMTPLVKLEEVVDTQKEPSENIRGSPQIMTPIVKIGSNTDQEVLASKGKKKPPVSSFKLLKVNNGNSKFTTTTPVKSIAPTSSKRDNLATPMSNNNPSASNTADKKRYTPKSLQMSVNFTPIRELNRLTASVMRKFDSTRNGAASSKASKDSLTPLRTPIMGSKEMPKYSSLTPLTEKKGNKTPIDLSSSSNHTAGPKWSLLSTENKMRSPVISSPFSLRTEERAARRKKKLEEKFNANEAQNVQPHTKLKEKTETEIIRKLRQSFCFRARPLPDFYKESKASKDETKKDPVTHSELLKEGRKSTPNMVQNRTPFPSSRPSPKTSGSKNFLGKSGRNSTHPITSNYTMITTHENTPPNIQHGYQNDRSYK